VDFRLSVNPQCMLAARKASNILGCANKGTVRVSAKVIIPLYLALVGPELKYCVQFWPPCRRKMVNWSRFSGDHQDTWGWTTCCRTETGSACR